MEHCPWTITLSEVPIFILGVLNTSIYERPNPRYVCSSFATLVATEYIDLVEAWKTKNINKAFISDLIVRTYYQS